MPIEVWLGHCFILYIISSHFFGGGCEGIALLGSMHLIALPSRVELIIIFYIRRWVRLTSIQLSTNPSTLATGLSLPRLLCQPIQIQHQQCYNTVLPLNGKPLEGCWLLDHSCSSSHWCTAMLVMPSVGSCLQVSLYNGSEWVHVPEK